VPTHSVSISMWRAPTSTGCTDGILDSLAVIIGVRLFVSKSARWMVRICSACVRSRSLRGSTPRRQRAQSAWAHPRLARFRRGGRARDGAGAGARCDRGRARVALTGRATQRAEAVFSSDESVMPG
jgi:hypothetical protein